jgi:16S rRNA (guanine966-N2)-methyltransferase
MDAQSSIRIIGGKWRSRKVSFMTKEGLRPTPDRVRETLFNWLAPYIVDAKCLDLFAGSGVLSFEALSRGAASAVALENDSECCKQILNNKEILQAHHLEVLNKNSLDWLQTPRFHADIIFVDPPYKQQILFEVLDLIAANKWIAPQGLVYFEQDKPVSVEQLPEHWSIWRSSKAGKVYFYLALSGAE